VTAKYLRENYPAGARVFVICAAPLKEIITDAGIEVVEREADAVVASMDRALTYETIKQDTLLIRGGVELSGHCRCRSSAY